MIQGDYSISLRVHLKLQGIAILFDPELTPVTTSGQKIEAFYEKTFKPCLSFLKAVKAKGRNKIITKEEIAIFDHILEEFISLLHHEKGVEAHYGFVQQWIELVSEEVEGLKKMMLGVPVK